MSADECPVCGGCEWVCENHHARPWEGLSARPDACGCGAGSPCPGCNDMCGVDMNEVGDDLKWSLPANLRWLDDNRDAAYAPCGMLVGVLLRTAADRIEAIARDRDGAEGGGANAAPVPQDRQAEDQGIAP